ELDIAIFNRSRHPIAPTPIGRKIIDQAKLTLTEMKKIPEIAHYEKGAVYGEVNVGIIPTIAPYIVPNFFTFAKKHFPELTVRIHEIPTAQQLYALNHGELDISLLATRENGEDLLEIPLYEESLVLYASEGHKYLDIENIETEMLDGDGLWVLRSEHCLSTQILSICHLKRDLSACYSAGNIYTLIDIVDAQGGYTVIPEFHCSMLSEEQNKRVRRFTAPEPVRDVSLYIRSDYFKEGILNAVAKCICGQIPDNKLKKGFSKGIIKI
ncbi:MAG: hydrogen peroxide-inducible genes activator, partial [Bacteroidales bacterium]|nr:hydrogen peroxide-inducible genes activator [Bacteroidales bacterium]